MDFRSIPALLAENLVDEKLLIASRGSVAERTDVLLGLLGDASEKGYIGEPVSQLEHALQAAAHARRAGADDALVLAALFHDIGHLALPDAKTMNGLGVVEHERIGAEMLLLFGCAPSVARAVGEHVRAKRYLCRVNPVYEERLSEASRETLRQQGGPLSESEAELFAAIPDYKRFLALRAWDELAKEPDACVPGLDDYRDLVRAHLLREKGG